MADSLDLQRRVVGTRPGTGVTVEVVRNGESVTLDVTIGELDLEAEGRGVRAASRGRGRFSEGFGITLQEPAPQVRGPPQPMPAWKTPATLRYSIRKQLPEVMAQVDQIPLHDLS